MPPESSTEEQVSTAAPAGAGDQGAQAAESPAAERTDEAAAGSSTATEGARAGSPTADGKPRSTLEAVEAALKKEAGTDGSSPSDGEKGTESDTSGTDAAKGAAAKDDAGPLTDEEFHKYGPKARQRIRTLVEGKKDLERQVADLGPKAEKYQEMVDYVALTGMSRDEVNQLMTVGAALKSDPFKALEYVRPVYEQLVKLTGGELPDELRQQVEGGFLPEATARELSQRRAREAIDAESQRRADETRKATEQRTELAKRADSAAAAVSKWDSEWKAADPDYPTKAPRVLEKIELKLTRLLQQGPDKLPKTDAEAVALAKQAKDEVEAELKPLLAQRREIRPDPRGSGSSTAVAKPKTMAEALARVV